MVPRLAPGGQDRSHDAGGRARFAKHDAIDALAVK